MEYQVKITTSSHDHVFLADGSWDNDEKANIKFTDKEELIYELDDIFSEFFSNDHLSHYFSEGFARVFALQGKLHTVITYKSSCVPPHDAQKRLIDYTLGQLSDGIGENLEQDELCIDFFHYKPVYLSTWVPGITATCEITEI